MHARSPARNQLPRRPHRAILEDRDTSPEWMVATGMELLGGWIREARVRAGMTQAQLARLAGVHQSTLSRLERGRLDGLRLHRLAAIIAVLDSRLGDDLDPIVA
jgi:DNA-binding XRE family transcriptional regulator